MKKTLFCLVFIFGMVAANATAVVEPEVAEFHKELRTLIEDKVASGEVHYDEVYAGYEAYLTFLMNDGKKTLSVYYYPEVEGGVIAKGGEFCFYDGQEIWYMTKQEGIFTQTIPETRNTDAIKHPLTKSETKKKIKEWKKIIF